MISLFRTRSAHRDRETDSQRLSRLTALLNDLIAEMNVERDGLEARCRKTKDDAAFSLLALEQGGDRHMSDRVDELTISLIVATNRLKSLQDQIGFLGGLLEETAAFGRKSAEKAETAGGETLPARP